MPFFVLYSLHGLFEELASIIERCLECELALVQVSIDRKES
jgi:hypothetical protein